MNEAEMIELVGIDNFLILHHRYAQHQEGLRLACDASVERVSESMCAPTINREVGDIPGCVAVNETQHLSFLDRMKKIEEEFLSGVRKRD